MTDSITKQLRRVIRETIRQCLREAECEYCGKQTPYTEADAMPCPECADRLEKDPGFMSKPQGNRPANVKQPLPVKERV